MKLYPFDLPDGIHPDAWVLLGFGLPGEVVDRLARHLFDNLGVQLPSMEPVEYTFKWAVGTEAKGYERLEVGDVIDEKIDGGAVRLTAGAAPPGIRLNKTTKRLSGTLTHTGLYTVTVTVFPTVKYDPLGSPGGPEDSGIWIPIEQARQQVATALNEFPATVEDLSDAEKDRLLAELMAERDGRIIREADYGN